MGKGFVGALDGLTTNAWGMWSQHRRLLSSYTGAIKRVRESSGSTEANISPLASGEIDTATMEAFCGSGDGFNRTLLAQYGANDLVQTSASQQPRVVASGTAEVNAAGHPTARWDNSNDVLHASISPALTEATFVVSAKLTAVGFYDMLAVFRSSEIELREVGNLDASQFQVNISGDAVTVGGSPAMTSWHVYSFNISSTTGAAQFWIDGTSIGTLSGKTIPTLTDLFLGARDAAGSYCFNGCISEAALFSPIIGTTQRQAVEAAFLAVL